MATSGTLTGWHYDRGNSRLDMYYRGTRSGHIDTSGLKLLGPDPWVDVKAQGAVGDGVTDDTAACQAAVDAAWAVGGVVYLPPGEYALGNITLPNGDGGNARSVALVGAQHNYVDSVYGATKKFGTRLRFTKTDASDFISTTSTVYNRVVYRFENLTLIGPDTETPRTTTSGNAIKISGTGVPNVYMRNVRISLFYGGAGVWLDNCEDSTLQDVWVLCCATGFKFTTAFNANTIINCSAEYCTTYGFDIGESGSNVMVGGLVQSNEKTGMYVHGAIGWRFISVHFEGNNSTATAGKYALEVIAAVGATNQHLTFDGCRFGAAADKINVDGVSGALSTFIHFRGGITGANNPQLTLGSYTAMCRVSDFLSPGAAISDSGSLNSLEGAAAGLATLYLGLATTAPTAMLDVNSDILRLRTAKTPATADAAGNTGDICWDSGFLYICVGPSTWKRTAIATWP